MLRCTRREGFIPEFVPRARSGKGLLAVVCAAAMVALSGCMGLPRCEPLLPDGGSSGLNLDCSADAGADAGSTDGGNCDGGSADGGC